MPVFIGIYNGVTKMLITFCTKKLKKWVNVGKNVVFLQPEKLNKK